MTELAKIHRKLDRLLELVQGISRRIEPDALYTATEAAALTGMHIETMRLNLRCGIVKGSRRAGDWRVKGSELLKLG